MIFKLYPVESDDIADLKLEFATRFVNCVENVLISKLVAEYFKKYASLPKSVLTTAVVILEIPKYIVFVE